MSEAMSEDGLLGSTALAVRQMSDETLGMMQVLIEAEVERRADSMKTDSLLERLPDEMLTEVTNVLANEDYLALVRLQRSSTALWRRVEPVRRSATLDASDVALCTPFELTATIRTSAKHATLVGG